MSSRPAVRYVALVGLTLIVVRGTVLARLRAVWPALFECAQCSGFWVGAVGGASFAACDAARGPELLERAIVAAGAVSVLATVADFVLAFLASRTKD